MYWMPCAVLTMTERRALSECFKPWLFMFNIYMMNSMLFSCVILKMSIEMICCTKFLR